MANIEVYEPFERTKNLVKKDNDWAFQIAINYEDLKKATVFLQLLMALHQMKVMIELGIAIALQKEIYSEMILKIILITIIPLNQCYFADFQKIIAQKFS